MIKRRKPMKRGRLVRKPFKKAPKRPVHKSKHKVGTWTLKKADSVFSAQILARDKKCQFPSCVSTTKLTCSHYHGRGRYATRFDPDNCVIFCLFHHFMSREWGMEFQKQTIEKHGWEGRYTRFMRERLGEARFAALNERAKLAMKQSAALKAFQL